MSLSYPLIRSILTRPKLFVWGIAIIIFVSINVAELGELDFFFGLFFYALSLLAIKKIVLALLSYDLKKKQLTRYENRIKNVFIINLPIFLVLVGLKNIFPDDDLTLFGYLILLTIAYFILVFFSLKKKKIHLHSSSSFSPPFYFRPGIFLLTLFYNFFIALTIPSFFLLLLLSLF